MGIVVFSPHSGRPVKVRDQDAGRAVRDEEGRIFYVLPKSDGSGHYGALTRAGGVKEEQRARDYEAKSGQIEDRAKQNVLAVHDATGKKRSSSRGKLVIAALALLCGAMAYLFTLGPFGHAQLPWQPPPAQPLLQTPSGLRYAILRPGSGQAVRSGQRVTIRKTPGDIDTAITLGSGEPSKFVDEGVQGMRVGERRLLVTPAPHNERIDLELLRVEMEPPMNADERR